MFYLATKNPKASTSGAFLLLATEEALPVTWGLPKSYWDTKSRESDYSVIIILNKYAIQYGLRSCRRQRL